MRRSATKDFHTGSRQVTITPGRGEQVNLQRVAWLREHPGDTFLPLEVDAGHGRRGATLRYDAGQRRTLRSYLRQETVGRPGLVRMLTDLAVTQLICLRGKVPPHALLFDERSVFVDEEGGLAFVCVPLDGMTFAAENSPLELLRVLSGGRLKAADEDAQELVQHLAAHVSGAKGAFSLNAYRSFLKRTCGIRVDSDGVVHGVDEAADTQPEEASNPAEDAESQRCELVRLVDDWRHPLPMDTTLVVGRGTGCDVQLSGNPTISRRHAALRCRTDGVVLQDLGSKAGTTVSGQVLGQGKAVLLPYGRSFFLSSEEYRVEISGS